MKVLIWSGCLIIATILNGILGSATGIKVGYVLFYFAVSSIANKLCNMWDEHKENKAIRKAIIAPKPQPFSVNTEQICFCRKCGEKLIVNSQFCRKCGTEVVM